MSTNYEGDQNEINLNQLRQRVKISEEARSLALKEARLKLAKQIHTELAIDALENDGPQTLEQAYRQRYKMPASVIAQLKLAGAEAALRLAMLIENLDTLKPEDQIKLKAIELAMDKAFGRGETASAFALANAKVGDEDVKHGRLSISKQLEELEGRGEFNAPELRKANAASSANKDFTFPQPTQVAKEVEVRNEHKPAYLTREDANGERKVIKLTRADIPHYNMNEDVA